MPRHDQLLKDLIRIFFADLVRIVHPDLAARLRLERVQFLDKQSFTDWPEGDRREMDLLAEVPLAADDRPLLVHVEIEARARRTMKDRLWRYYMQLRLRYGLPVVPILLNLKGGPAGVTFETLEEGLLDLEIARFRHCRFGLSGCLAEEYLARPEPLAWGLAALMRSRRWSRAEQKLECLRRIAGAPGLTGMQNFLLANCVETYVELAGEDAAAYARLRQAAGNRRVRAMQMTWADRLEAQGMEKGIERGLAKGRSESVRALRRVVLRQLGQRFGRLPESVRRRIQAIDSVEGLAKVAERILLIRSLDEV